MKKFAQKHLNKTKLQSLSKLVEKISKTALLKLHLFVPLPCHTILCWVVLGDEEHNFMFQQFTESGDDFTVKC